MKNAVRDSYYEGPCVILLGYEVDFSVVFRDFKGGPSHPHIKRQ